MLGVRTRSQLIEGATARTVLEAAEHMLAVQAQDLAAGRWALGVRVRGSRVSDVDDALAAGAVVRSWPMRGTLHFVPSVDLRWMLDVTSARTIAATATRRRQLELDDRVLGRASELIGGRLSGRRALSRAETMQLLEDDGIATTGQRGYHVLWHLAQTGVIVWGPMRDGQQHIALLDEWAPSPRVLEHDEALAEFALRFLTGHGPATVQDFAKWADITLTDARIGFAEARPQLTELVLGGESLWMSGELDSPIPRATGVHALPGFEEYLLGYRDRALFLDPHFAELVVPGGNGVFKPLIVSRGHIVGTWRRAQKGSELVVTPEPFRQLNPAERVAFERSASRYARFLGARLTTGGS
jgi:hypothetical protein